MRPFLLALLLAVACSGDDDPPATVDVTAPPVDGGGACDAAPVDGCGDCQLGFVCVYYDTESGFSSCTDYSQCVETDLACPPGTCSAECEAALCPDPYTCDATATERYTCTRP